MLKNLLVDVWLSLDQTVVRTVLSYRPGPLHIVFSDTPKPETEELVVRAIEASLTGQPLPHLKQLQTYGFQREVEEALCRIPFGETRTYGEIANEIGRPKAARAVGRACACNMLPLIIPCHRVVAANGGLGGFAFGTELKQQLLDHERAMTIGM